MYGKCLQQCLPHSKLPANVSFNVIKVYNEVGFLGVSNLQVISILKSKISQDLWTCYTTMQIWLILLNCTLKKWLRVNFILCIFYQN